MNVLILSSDRILADALKFELKLAGIEAEIALDITNGTVNGNTIGMDEKESCLILCDLDSVGAVPDSITITRDRAKEADFHRPFLTADLVSEVERRIALKAVPEGPAAEIRVDNLRISGDTVRLGEREIQLTATEASLLALLASRPGTPVSREEIARTVWGEDCLDTNRCEVYIRYLREKLEQPDAPRRIITVRGKGYMLNPLT